MICDCPVCKGRSFNEAGFYVAENEVLPFVKTAILKSSYPNHPIPHKYNGLTASLLAYSQAIAYDRAHNENGKKYYTNNCWMLKFKDELNLKFKEVIITDKSEIDKDDLLREVCEFNS